MKKQKHSKLSEKCRHILSRMATSPDNTFSGSVLAKEMSMSRKTWFKYKKKLMSLGLIRELPKIYPPMYKLTKRAENINVSHFSYCTTTGDIGEKIGAEDIYITIPIGDNSKATLPKDFWKKINDKLNNNIQKHTTIDLDGFSVSLRETTKSVIIQMSPVKLRDFSEVIPLYNKLVFDLFTLLSKYNYWIDPTKARCSDPEFTYSNNIMKETGDQLTKPRMREYLGFPREKILPGDKPEESYIDINNSPHKVTAESNHRPLANAWRSFPLKIEQMVDTQQRQADLQEKQTEIMQKYANEIEKHLETYSMVQSAFNDLKQERIEQKNYFDRALKTFQDAIVRSPEKRSPVIEHDKPSHVIDRERALIILANSIGADRVPIEITQDLDEIEFEDQNGNTKKISNLKRGARLWMRDDKSFELIKQMKANLLKGGLNESN